MKITVRSKKQDSKILLADLKPGTVFEYDDGTIALRGDYPDEVFLLQYNEGDDWFGVAKNYLSRPIKKILGQIIEVIVE